MVNLLGRNHGSHTGRASGMIRNEMAERRHIDKGYQPTGSGDPSNPPQSGSVTTKTFELVCKHGYGDSGGTVQWCPQNCTEFNYMPGVHPVVKAEPRNLIRFGLERAALALALEKSERTLNAMMEMSEAYLNHLNSRATVGSADTLPSDEAQVDGALEQVERILKRLR